MNSNHFLKDFLDSSGYGHNFEDYTKLENWFLNLTQLKFLERFCNEDSIEEIIVHGPNWVQTFSHIRKDYYFNEVSEQDWQLALEILSLSHKQIWNEASPFVSYQERVFNKNWRITLIHEKLTPKKFSKVFFRHQKNQSFNLKDFGLSIGQTALLKDIVQNKKNIIVSGATGSGKTSFLKALINNTHEREHITILEDTYEIHHQSPFTTNLISASTPGKSLKDYCQYTLRMRPDRIILGEIRSEEVVPFLLSINTGHNGMMASIHANSALDSLSRLSLLFQIYSGQEGLSYQDILKMICQGVDYIIYLKDKSVVDIIEIIGCEGNTPYYKKWEI